MKEVRKKMEERKHSEETRGWFKKKGNNGYCGKTGPPINIMAKDSDAVFFLH